MLPEDDLEQRWLKLEAALVEKLGQHPCMDDVLLYIGTRESGLPPKNFTDADKYNLRQMAVSTILVPGRYYEMIWVDDFGWPNFRQLRREPELSIPEREKFLQPYVVMYAEKHHLI